VHRDGKCVESIDEAAPFRVQFDSTCYLYSILNLVRIFKINTIDINSSNINNNSEREAYSSSRRPTADCTSTGRHGDAAAAAAPG
jgi:hypothetical protein